AVEMIQTATLIHDDFVDQHPLRRNRAAAWTLEGGRRAVLLGDIIFASAIHMMSEIGRDDGLIVSRAIAEISRGAYHEPLDPPGLLEVIENNRIETGLYPKIISLKTGVLFGAACELGAITAGVNDKERESWRQYGLRIGEAYQIADDLQDVEQCLLNQYVEKSRMASITPALLFFVGENGAACILDSLRKERTDLKGELLANFLKAAESMKAEKEARLRSAVDGFMEDRADGDIYRLVIRAPWELIAMFDGATIPESSP
ncbi:MAG TPA: polyprenyl synthetase family protein, partial [Geobacteraceae bacterium]|nr:polyprenyl synthetase family protein [Geobacteraceae bacterium]